MPPESNTSSDSFDDREQEEQKKQPSNKLETIAALAHDCNNVSLETSLAMLFLYFTKYFDETGNKILNHPAVWGTFTLSLVTNISLNLALELREAKKDHKINIERLAFLIAISTALGGTICSLTKLAKTSAFLFSAAFLMGLVGFAKINIDTINNASKTDSHGKKIHYPFTRLLLNLIRPTTNSLLQFLAFLTPVLGFGVASDAIPEACFMGAAVSLIRVGLASIDMVDHSFGLFSETPLSTLMINAATQNRWSFFGNTSSDSAPKSEEEESLLGPENPEVNSNTLQLE